MFNHAYANTIIGATSASGIYVLDLMHDTIPYISTLGIIAGSILAVHGVVELSIKYYRGWQERMAANMAAAAAQAATHVATAAANAAIVATTAAIEAAPSEIKKD